MLCIYNKFIMDNLLNKLFDIENDYFIYTYLDINSLFNLQLANKYLYEAINTKFLYRFFRSFFPDYSNDISLKQTVFIWFYLIKEKRNQFQTQIMNEQVESEDFIQSNELNFLKLSERKTSLSCKTNSKNDQTFVNNFDNTHSSPSLVSNLNNDISVLSIRKKSYPKDKLEENIAAISRDVDRTFHFGMFKTKEGQTQLKFILEEMAKRNSDIGYCQGMNFVAGALLEFTKSVDDSLEIFQFILDYLDVYYLYIEQMPDYSIRIYQAIYYIKLHMPDLYSYFKTNDYPFDLILQKWIMTLFCNFLDMSKLLIVLHLFIIDGWEAIIKYCFIILELTKEKLKTYDLEQISNYGIDKTLLSYMSHKEFHSLYFRYESKYKFNNPISNEALSVLRDQFYIELAEKKLKLKNWKDDQISALEKYSEQSKIIKEAVRKEILSFKSRIEESSKEYHKLLNQYQSALFFLNKNKHELICLIDERDGLELVLKQQKQKEEEENYDNNIHKIQQSDFITSKVNTKEKEKSFLSKINVFSYVSLFRPSTNPVVNNKDISYKFKERYEYIIKRIDELNNILSTEFISVDTIKEKVEKVESNKKKLDKLLKNYIHLCSIKEKSLLKDLSEHLKKSQSFKTRYEF